MKTIRHFINTHPALQHISVRLSLVALASVYPILLFFSFSPPQLQVNNASVLGESTPQKLQCNSCMEAGFNYLCLNQVVGEAVCTNSPIGTCNRCTN